MRRVDREPFEERVRGVATLDHPVTRAVYRLLVERGRLSRDEASERLGIARSVAAFHLDKLADAGLAEAHFERLTGRAGPGAGRPAKVYSRADREIEVSLPERHYGLAGGLLADAVETARTDGVPVERALRDAAVETGRRIGLEGRAGTGGRRGRKGRRDSLLRVLERHGYEPRLRGEEIVLANCPFHELAQQHRDLVCGMNLDLLAGVIDGLGADDGLTARLAPEPGYCCVRLLPRR
jgi:predicted ArsR family transcriptional regulator